jgi:DNA-binding transcriptional regulator LsrR (DeoR family)
MGENSQEELMVIAAWLHYVERMTHEEIAEQLHMSRVSITRLLQRARNEGVVQFTITRPLPEQYQLETRFKEQFHMRSVTIVRTMSDPSETTKEVCRAGAATLKKLIFPGCRLGLAFSSTLSYMVDFLDNKSMPSDITIQELAGTYLSPSAPYGISWRIAEKLGARLVSMPVPVVVQSEEVRDAIMQEPSIREAFNGVTNVDLAVVGLGKIGPDSTLIKTGHFSQELMREFKAKGAAGDILLHFYDQAGNYVPNPLQNRMIVLSWEDVKRIPDILAVATGPDKVDAIHGALCSGVVQHLVTDMETALAVMKK